MDKLTAIKIKYKDGTYSDQIPVSVLGENVEWDATHTLVDILGSIDVDITGTIQDQISQLFNEKVSASAMQDYVTNSMPTYITNWLNTNVNPVGSAVVVDSSLTVSGAAADAKVTGDRITAVETGLDGAEDDIADLKNALKYMPFQYIDKDKAISGKYWNSNESSIWTTDSTSYVAFPPFHIEAGTYYHRGFSTEFAWLKKDSDGSVVKITKEKSEDLESGLVYISFNSTNSDINKAVFTNFKSIDAPTDAVFPAGFVIPTISDLIGVESSSIIRQYLKTKDTDKYWGSYKKKYASIGWYAYDPIHVDAGLYYSTIVGAQLNNFSWFLSDDYTIKTTLGQYSETNGLIKLPTSGTIYISSKSDHTLFCNYIPADGDYATNVLFDRVNSYNKVSDLSERQYLDKDTFTPSANTVSRNGDTFTLSNDDTGVDCGTFASNSSKVRVIYDFETGGSDIYVRVYIRIYKNAGGVSYIKKFETRSAERCIGEFEFDASSYNVYEDGSRYQIIVWGSAGDIIIMNSVKVFEADGIKDSPFYKPVLGDMLTVMSNAIESASSEHEVDVDHIIMRGQNGEKRGLVAGSDGSLYTFPYVPNKYVVFGNSITCGHVDPLLGRFGMASTRYENDWVYKVDSAIKERNANATFERVYSSPFEHCETIADARAWLTEISSNLTNDVDLVLVEMGDNVNTETKRTVFATTFPEFLTLIRTRCPKARVIVIGIWYNNITVKSIMTNGCANFGCDFVDITALNSQANQATVGDTIYYSDGTTGTISAGTASHPGDNGMIAIGNAVIKKMMMD